MVKIVLMALIAFGVQLHAADQKFNLKFNMLKLNAEMGSARESMIRNDRAEALKVFKRLKTEVHDLLSNKEKIESMLPPEKKQKSSIALESAKLIAENIELIEDAYGENTRDLTPRKRQIKAQRAYTSIELACFHCHNLVRDEL
ncbi:hypothetical protein WCX72_05675 [Sulfurimonas sp. HSL1-6]|uniref:hypothetical protein n=1 Tax=Thiomicrolovo immobilis TaxID=3131935 RepID=UPI0031F97118